MVEGPDSSKPDDIPSTKNEAPKKKGKEEKQPTKVVIRKLPGSMSEESFLEFISPLFEHDYFYYVQNENPGFGDQSYSRAYINFVNVEDVFTFTMKFDDYIFIDETGQEYPAVVEYAPFQRIPKNRGNRKADSLCGTIEEDEDYQEFVRQLESEEQQEHKAITEHYFDLANDENEEKVTTTPLIEFLMSRKNEYIKYKEEKKEERRRRDMERRKLKEESRRIKKESKEPSKAKIMEKSKEEKKITQDSKIFEEITSSSRVRGKSYQEERQRDLARRKGEEKSAKADDNKENNKNVVSDKSQELDDEKTSKEGDSAKPSVRSDHKDEEYYRKNYDDKKSYREDDRKSGNYSREKDDKKYSYGVKKREFVGGYDHDGKYKGSKSGGYYYDDYKSRYNSYQKNSYAGGKYGKSKDYYEEKMSKRYDSKTKKHEHSDYKDSKKPQKEFDKKYADSKSGDVKSDVRSTDKSGKKEDRKETEINTKLEGNNLSRSSSKDDEGQSGNTSEIESSKSQDSKKEKKENDPRVERRIKNKDRPALEIYRPGMGKFSRQRLERNKSTEGKECD